MLHPGVQGWSTQYSVTDFPMLHAKQDAVNAKQHARVVPKLKIDASLEWNRVLVSYYLLIGYCILPVSQASHVFGHNIFTGLSEQSAARHQDLASKQKGFNVGFGLIAAVRPCGVSDICCAVHKLLRKLQYLAKLNIEILF